MINNKTPGEDEIKIEATKTGGNRLHHILKALLNRCLLEGTTPSQWHEAIIIVIHKKVDTTVLENYRSISLLLHNKLIFRIITVRLNSNLVYTIHMKTDRFQNRVLNESS